MQTAFIANTNSTANPTAALFAPGLEAPRANAPKTGPTILKTLARKWDMIGVIALMSASAIYGVTQLMTLAH